MDNFRCNDPQEENKLYLQAMQSQVYSFEKTMGVQRISFPVSTEPLRPWWCGLVARSFRVPHTCSRLDRLQSANGAILPIRLLLLNNSCTFKDVMKYIMIKQKPSRNNSSAPSRKRHASLNSDIDRQSPRLIRIGHLAPSSKRRHQVQQRSLIELMRRSHPLILIKTYLHYLLQSSLPLEHSILGRHRQSGHLTQEKSHANLLFALLNRRGTQVQISPIRRIPLHAPSIPISCPQSLESKIS